MACPSVLTRPGGPLSAHTRLQILAQPVDRNSSSDPVRPLDISHFQNTTLHQYDEDVVRELSIPPLTTISPSATTLPGNYPHSHGPPTVSQPEGYSSSYLTSPLPHNVPLEQSKPRPRTLSAPVTPPSFFAQHGLPPSLPPPPRTTFYQSSSMPTSAPAPEADNIVSYIDSLLRGSYSQMLSKKTDLSVSSNSAPDLPQGGESYHRFSRVSPSTDSCQSTPRLPLPRLAELELSLEDMLKPDSFEPGAFEDFLTSPLLQDDSPDETPFLDTPAEDAWASPLVNADDDSFGCGEMPLFGATVKRGQVSADDKPVESLDVFGLLQLCTPSQPTAPMMFESSKVDSVTPAMDPLDATVLYTMPPTPALPPASLYSSPRLPSTLVLDPSTSSSSSTRSSTVPTAAVTASQPLRPFKPLPTGTRRNITSASLVPLDAPTQPRQYLMPSVTSRKVLPAAFLKGKKRAHSEVDGGDDADQLIEEGNLDSNTQDAIEAKRRQNTLAARRSRQRKLEHVRELEDTVERITRDRDMWMARAYDAEEKLRAAGHA